MSLFKRPCIAGAALLATLFPATAIAADTETFEIDLPELVCCYWTTSYRTVTVDLGVEFESISSVKVQWCGTIDSGVGRGDGVEIPVDELFEWDACFAACLDGHGADPWFAFSSAIDGPFDEQSPFTLGFNPNWDAMLDGCGTLMVTLQPVTGLPGDMVIEPTGLIDAAKLIIEGVPIIIVLGDANGDGLVTIDDVIEIILKWGTCPGGCQADLNGDHFIGIDDLVLVVQNWG